MASIVGIVNSAGVKIGAKERTTSLSDGKPLSNLAADRYVEIRDELLRGHPWNFAIERAKLARSTDTPAYGFAYEYQLPSDWLRTVEVFDNDAGVGYVDYKEEGDKLLSDAENLYLKYVQVIEDPNMMTPDFRECIAYTLAKESGTSIVQSKSLKEDIKADLKSALIKAKSTDSLGDRPDRRPNGSWVTARFRTYGRNVIGGN